MDSSPSSCRLFSEWNSSRASCNLAPNFIRLVSHLFCRTGCSLSVGGRKKIPFCGINANFFPSPLPQSSASISSGVERIRPPPADPQHAPISASRVFPPAVRLNLGSSVNYTANYRAEQTFRPGENKRLTSPIGFLFRPSDSAGSWCPRQQDSFDAVENIREWSVRLLLKI